MPVCTAGHSGTNLLRRYDQPPGSGRCGALAGDVVEVVHRVVHEVAAKASTMKLTLSPRVPVRCHWSPVTFSNRPAMAKVA